MEWFISKCSEETYKMYLSSTWSQAKVLLRSCQLYWGSLWSVSISFNRSLCHQHPWIEGYLRGNSQPGVTSMSGEMGFPTISRHFYTCKNPFQVQYFHFCQNFARHRKKGCSALNTLIPISGDIWQHKYGSTLAQAMIYCLTAPIHHKNQCLFVINGVLWYTSGTMRKDVANDHVEQVQWEIWDICSYCYCKIFTWIIWLNMQWNLSVTTVMTMIKMFTCDLFNNVF